VSFALLPLITRYLGPEPYGTYALTLAIANLLAMFGTAWVRNVAFRLFFDAVKDGRTGSFYVTIASLQAVIVTLLFSIAVLVAWWSPNPWIPVSALLSAGAMMLAGDLLSLSVGVLQAEGRAGRFALAEATAASTRFVGTLAGLVAGARTPEFLFLAAAAASALGAVVAVIALRKVLTGPPGFDRHALALVSGRVLGAMPFSVGEWLHATADRVVLDMFATRAVVGIYAAGHALGDRLTGSLVMAVFMMAWPDTLAAWNRGGTSEARLAIRRQIVLFLWFTVGPLVVLMLYAPSVVRLLGGAYQTAAVIIPWVALAAWVRGLGNCFNRHFELKKRYGALSAMTLGGAAINVALNFLLVPRFGAEGAAVATLVAQSSVTVGFIATRDRDLVDFPFGDAGVVAAATVVATSVAWPWLGQTIQGLLVFAVAYATTLAVALAARLLPGSGRSRRA